MNLPPALLTGTSTLHPPFLFLYNNLYSYFIFYFHTVEVPLLKNLLVDPHLVFSLPIVSSLHWTASATTGVSIWFFLIQFLKCF